MSDVQYEAAGELLRVLSAPIRLAIITRLADGPATVSELTTEVGHSQPLVSQHLRILRSVRLVHAHTEGRERVYELVDEHVAHIVADAIRHTAEPAHAAGARQRPSSANSHGTERTTNRSATTTPAVTDAAATRPARARASSARSTRQEPS